MATARELPTQSNTPSGASKRAKPAKPYPDFPLFPHASGRWAKKIHGKFHYCGSWADGWEAALETFLDNREAWYAKRRPRAKAEDWTVRDLLNRFRDTKLELLETGEIVQATYNDYVDTCDAIRDTFGLDRAILDLAATDFKKLRTDLAKRLGPVALGNEINRVRIVFKYAFDAEMAPAPIRFGPDFKRPSRRVLRRERHAKGPRMFSPAEIHAMLAKATIPLKAMILLAINCGFGNSDVANLPISAIDLKAAWINFPRPKTSITRKCPLWPQTVKAIKAAIAARPSPKDSADAGLLFITRQGNRWAKASRHNPDDPVPEGKVNCDNPVSKEITKLLKELGLQRPGLNFYALRHTFETIGGESLDQVAVDAIMGHAPAGNDMASVYRERITDERLAAVTKFVRKWLFSSKKIRKQTKATKRSA